MPEKKSKGQFVLTIIAILLIIAAIGIGVVVVMNETQESSSTNKDNIFEGYQVTELTENINITYDLLEQYQNSFVYGNTDTMDGTNAKTISAMVDDNIHNYEVTLENGKLIFKEKYDSNGEELSGNSYEFSAERPINSYLVARSENGYYPYLIVALDSNATAYMYNSENFETNHTIAEVITNITKINTITPIKEIGYYDYSNVTDIDSYKAIYKDENDDIRFLTETNDLFFDSIFYDAISMDYQEQYVYVLKDGKMNFNYLTASNYLNNGEYDILYRGSFINYKDDFQDVYIIATDGYLYWIDNFNEDSQTLLNKVNDSKITKIGVKENEKESILIQFEDESTFELEEADYYQLLC